MRQETILVVDDDENMLEVLKLRLEGHGYNVITETGLKKALRIAQTHAPDLGLVDLKLGHESGIQLMEELLRIFPEMPVIILTAHGTIETAVEAMKLGAYSYLTKPFDRRVLLQQIKNGLEKTFLSREIRRLRALVEERYGLENIIGKSAVMRRVMNQISRVAETDTSICIYGESGTGKELAAKSLHLLSPRKCKPFVAINCAAIPEGLFESELFGHEKGAFTGAIKTRKGLFAKGHEGTVFLDEIGEMPESMQIKLLRILQEKQFYPVGSETPVKIDIRIISATNKNLCEQIQQGRFREDLYYRIHVIPIYIPSLRERKEDIPLLADHFRKHFSSQMKKKVNGFTPEAMKKLVFHSWPGNVRELQNTIEYAVAMATCDRISDDLIFDPLKAEPADIKPLKAAKIEFEKNYLANLLTATGGNISRAADLAGKHRPDMYDLLKKHHMKASDFKNLPPKPALHTG